MRERSINDLLNELAEAQVLQRDAERLAEEARQLTASAGADLRRLREEAGLTQSDVADGLGVTKGYVSQVENGASTSPRSLAFFAHTIATEGTAHAQAGRRSAKEDLRRARKAKDD